MNANILHDTSFPHGTPDGFKQGCHGSHCPSEVSCRTVHTRWAGDWAFRRQLHEGMTPIEIVTAEQDQAREAAEAARKAKRARPGVRTSGTANDRRASANKARAGTQALIPRDELRRLLDEGLTDREIADLLGLERRQVTGTRNNAGWERNPDTNRRPTRTTPATTGTSS